MLFNTTIFNHKQKWKILVKLKEFEKQKIVKAIIILLLEQVRVLFDACEFALEVPSNKAATRKNAFIFKPFKQPQHNCLYLWSLIFLCPFLYVRCSYLINKNCQRT